MKNVKSNNQIIYLSFFFIKNWSFLFIKVSLGLSAYSKM